MTIKNREMNARYSAFLTACENAPKDMFEDAKTIAETIGHIADNILLSFESAGLKPCNCDGIRNIEVELYAFALASDQHGIISGATALGETIEAHPEIKDQVFAGLARDAAFIRQQRGDEVLAMLDAAIGGRAVAAGQLPGETYMEAQDRRSRQLLSLSPTQLRTAREARQITQDEAANRISTAAGRHVDRRTVMRYEMGDIEVLPFVLLEDMLDEVTL